MVKIGNDPKKVHAVLGSDHGGFALKNELLSRLKGAYSISDLGAHAFDPSDDYPDFSEAVAREVASGRAERGILLCGSGVGACIAANKIPGARASVCHDTYSAHQGVEHDDMNILCLGARVVGIELATEIARAFLEARFIGTGRYLRRVNKIRALDRASERGTETERRRRK